MAYRYDVFISYRRPMKSWVFNYLKDLIEHYLPEALDGRNVTVFFDTENIHGSDAWENRLRKALSESRCLVPVLTPSYFTSAWCTKEFAVMEKRSLNCGFQSLQEPGGLIVPVTVNHGDYYPVKIHALPCWQYYRSKGNLEQMSFWEKFEGTVREWVFNDLARAIKKAPEWNAEWLNPEWTEVSTDHLFRELSETQGFQPKL